MWNLLPLSASPMEEQLLEAQWSPCKPLLLSCKLCTAVRAVDGVPGNLYLKRMEAVGTVCRTGWRGGEGGVRQVRREGSMEDVVDERMEEMGRVCRRGRGEGGGESGDVEEKRGAEERVKERKVLEDVRGEFRLTFGM